MPRWFRSSAKREVDIPSLDGPRLSPLGPNENFSTGLKKLFEGEKVIVDVVFVHGLNGHRERTWTADGAKEPWMSTILPNDLPKSRIFTFGYDAGVVDWRSVVSQSRVGNHAMNLLNAVATQRDNDGTAERPLIFVAHSMGGLVCADMLVSSRQRMEPHLQTVCGATCGVVFLGTPHQGSSLAPWAEALARSIGVLKRTNTKVLEVLKRDSEVLARIQDSFHALVRDRSQSDLPSIEICCFYEELPVPGVGSIVTLQSAIIPGYTAIGIHRNHMDMTKFSSYEDPGYVAVAAELRRWVRKINNVQTLSGDGRRKSQDTTIPSLSRTPAESQQYSTRANTSHRQPVSCETTSNAIQMSEASLHLDSYLTEVANHQSSLSRYGTGRLHDDCASPSFALSPRQSGMLISTLLDRSDENPRENVKVNEPRQDQTDRPISNWTSWRRGSQLPLGRQDGLDMKGGSSPLMHVATVFEVPLPRNPHFVGQELPLQVLDNELSAYAQSRFTSLHRLILTGMGGIGKTELAIQFANSNKRKFRAIFWADATTENSLNASFIRSFRDIRRRRGEPKGSISTRISSHSYVNLADTLLETQIDDAYAASLFLSWLSSTDEPWLLVVDNMDDPTMVPILEGSIRQLDAGFILITSRNQRAARLGTLVELCELPVDTCAEMLQKAAQRWSQRTVKDQDQSRLLVERLGCLPLAIDQAAAFIMACRLSIEEYIDLFAKHTDYLLDKSAENRYHSTKAEYANGKYDTVLKTWEISFNYVRKINPASGDLLQLFAFMSPAQISESLFAKYTFPHERQWSARGYFEKIDKKEKEGLQFSEGLKDCLSDHNRYQDACETLLRFSLVKRRRGEGSRSLSIHPLIHHWISSRMSPSERLQWLRQAASFLSVSLDPWVQWPALGKRSGSSVALPHLRSILIASQSMELERPLGNLPYVLYALPLPGTFEDCHSISKQLQSISAVTHCPMARYTAQLWELTFIATQGLSCSTKNLQIILEAFASVSKLRDEARTKKMGALNAILLQYVFQLALIYMANVRNFKCECLASSPCVTALIRKRDPEIKSVIESWMPIDPDHAKNLERKSPLPSLEADADELRWLFIEVISKPSEVLDFAHTEMRLHQDLSTYGTYPPLREAIASRLLDLIERQDRPAGDSMRSLWKLLGVAKGSEPFSSRLVDLSASMVAEMVTHRDSMLSGRLDPQTNARRWIAMRSTLTTIQAWERFVAADRGILTSHWTDQWRRFLLAFNLRLGLPIDPSTYLRGRKGQITTETFEEGTIQALFGNYKDPIDFAWTAHVVEFLKGLQRDYMVRDTALHSLNIQQG